MQTEISKEVGKAFVLPQQPLRSKQRKVTFVSNSVHIHFRCKDSSQYQLLSFTYYDSNQCLPPGIPLLKR